MTKNQALGFVDFICRHYDYVSQEDYFVLCDLILQAVVHDANQKGFARELAAKYPDMFTATIKMEA